MYDREKKLAEREDRERDSKSDIEIRTNLAKGDGKKMNKYQEKIAEQMWQDYIQY